MVAQDFAHTCHSYNGICSLEANPDTIDWNHLFSILGLSARPPVIAQDRRLDSANGSFCRARAIKMYVAFTDIYADHHWPAATAFRSEFSFVYRAIPAIARKKYPVEFQQVNCLRPYLLTTEKRGIVSLHLARIFVSIPHNNTRVFYRQIAL